MNRKLKTIIDNHTQDLIRINTQRRWWLYASSVVIVGILVIMFAWDWLEGFHSKSVWWLVVSLMLVISINWWYWTMKVIRRIIEHQKIEFELIGVIITDIKEVKKDIKFLAPKDLDKLD
ncbi:hypothetical protein UFOVP181_230 [uncultured Caudovirales phage]|uniref:Uncharacterized protein n=1 Tax=uncultured Caudovirales phage TaxID=2100421 RepID=A0A6J5KU16_9CAUD|nr:hypothetical protein UFOVP57_409 [uncultured Caudovirales phage]CAB5208881.1 hypothetical protein UFOVP181_230 [uncultured Caudovirales phage]